MKYSEIVLLTFACAEISQSKQNLPINMVLKANATARLLLPHYEAYLATVKKEDGGKLSDEELDTVLNTEVDVRIDNKIKLPEGFSITPADHPNLTWFLHFCIESE